MPIGLKYRTPAYEEDVYDCYFFEKNLQGDVVAIYNENGVKIGTYTYDAWGNVTATALSTNDLNKNIIERYNPFRYRSYYYDVETSLYYLQSRYYNPEWGRFVNADGYINANGDILGYNMFAYCRNNPIMYIDPNGEIAWWVVAIIVVAVIAIDHALAHFVPDGVAVFDDNGEDGMHDQFIYASGGGPGISENGDITFVDFEAGFYQGTSLTDFGDVSLNNLFTAQVGVGADFTGVPSIEASGVASIYKISYANSFSVFGMDIEISANLYYGAIGAGIEADFDKGKFKIIPPMLGLGCDFGIDFD